MGRITPRITFLVFVGCVFYLNICTPLQSDDYGYSLIGFDVHKHIQHYLNWSGRLVADFISPAILLIRQKTITAIVQTAALAGLLMLIGRSGRLRGEGTNAWIVVALAMIYFISNPDFGQANLWIVGSANYLWTALIYSTLLSALLSYIHDGELSGYIYPIALLSGCTNENVSLTIVGFCSLVFVWRLARDKTADFRILAVLLLLVIGACVLLGSPGNQVRIMHPEFSDWRGLTTWGKIELHFLHRLPIAIRDSKLAYLMAVALIWCNFRLSIVQVYFKDGKPTCLLMSIIFLIMALAANAIMVFSPGFPARATTGSFVFLLFSISLGMYGIAHEEGLRRLRKATSAALLLVFAAVYPAVAVAYAAISAQNQIRLNLIRENIGRTDRLLIPEFYFRQLPSKTYIFDPWTNMPLMATYYGYREINAYSIPFDFSILDDESSLLHREVVAPTGLEPSNVYAYKDRYMLDTVLVFELSSPDTYANRASIPVSLRIKDIFGRSHDYEIKDDAIRINGRLYLYKKVSLLPLFAIQRVEVDMRPETP